MHGARCTCSAHIAWQIIPLFTHYITVRFNEYSKLQITVQYKSNVNMEHLKIKLMLVMSSKVIPLCKISGYLAYAFAIITLSKYWNMVSSCLNNCNLMCCNQCVRARTPYAFNLLKSTTLMVRRSRPSKILCAIITGGFSTGAPIYTCE